MKARAVAFMLLMLPAWGCQTHGAPDAAPLQSRLQRAARFLTASVTHRDNVPSLQCSSPTMAQCRQEASVFATTFALEAVQLLGDAYAANGTPLPAGLAQFRARTRTFLRRSQRSDGWWSYYVDPDPMVSIVPADVDDTVAVAAALTRTGGSEPQRVTILGDAKTDRGTYYTWQGIRDHVDCGVNANVLYYLSLAGDAAGAAPLCDYLQAVVEEQQYPGCSQYYFDVASVPYLLARALEQGNAECLDGVGQRLLEQLAALPASDSALTQALLAATRVRLGACDAARPDIALLERSQRADGAWSAAPFFVGPGPSYFGSAALTTSVALEALTLYQTRCQTTIIAGLGYGDAQGE